jgi:hypothetical protein
MSKRNRARSRPWGSRAPKVLLSLLLLALISLPLSPAADIPYSWSGIGRVVAVGDLHGDYDRFVFILANPGVGIIDENLRWAAGSTHLVQLGDIMDRGPDARKIMDLLMRLEKEAEESGGMVHVLIGNHEEMNITGIALDYPQYVTPEQFVSFLPGEVRRSREAAYIAKLPRDRRRQAEADGLDLGTDDALRAYWQNVIRHDREARLAYVNNFNDLYGSWLLTKNTVIKINDVVYTHGGINEHYSKRPLRETNDLMRKELKEFRDRIKNPHRFLKPFKPKLVYASDGPVWFRGLATQTEGSAQAEVDRILDNLGARAIVVGHSYLALNEGGSPIATLETVSRFGGKVFVIDTGISEVYGGLPTALICEDGRFELWGETEEVAARSSPIVTPLQPLASAKAVEEFLRTAKAMARKTTAAGRTEPWRVTLEKDGVTRRAMFKYIDRRRPHPLPDSYRYELAAYALAKYLRLTFVPPVIEREIDGIPGSLQIFVENAVTEFEWKEQKLSPARPAAFERDREDLRLFEILVHEECDNDRDVLISRDDQRIYRVDFSEAFSPRKSFPPGCELRKCSRDLYGKLLGWDKKAVTGLLSPYLNKEEIEALHSRRDLIIRLIRRLIQVSGEGNVLI